MRIFFVILALFAGSAAYGADDAPFTTTCVAQLIDRDTGRATLEFTRVRSGESLEEARLLAEDNAMEACTLAVFRFGYLNSHECHMISCDE